jgi:eukaryotic-like serine/threonine-protein kinase
MPALAKAPVVRIGDVLDGKYVVERVLGAGGMGVVVAARHVSGNRLVAVKYIAPEHMGEREHVERFARETRASVRLASTHAVRIFDHGRFESGAPYLVMEYLEGQDLSELVERRGQLPAEVAVDYVLQACEAIAEAHAYGIIHRDIKPRNLFLTTDATGRPHVKVLDFGIAKSLVPLVDGASSITRTTAIVGSPQYMSPEQMRSSKDVDTRTDIWSLGATLFELLTATVAFDGNTVAEICAKVLAAPAPTLRRYRRDLPEPLERVIQRCLEKEQALRFADVYQLALALAPFAPRNAQGSASRIASVLYTPPTSCVVDAPVSVEKLATTLPMYANGKTRVMPRPGPSSPALPGDRSSALNGASFETAATGIESGRASGNVGRFLAFAVAACAAGTAIFLLLTGHRHRPEVEPPAMASQEPAGAPRPQLVLAPAPPPASSTPLDVLTPDVAANAPSSAPRTTGVQRQRAAVGAPVPPQLRPNSPPAPSPAAPPPDPPKPPKPSETF